MVVSKLLCIFRKVIVVDIREKNWIFQYPIIEIVVSKLFYRNNETSLI